MLQTHSSNFLTIVFIYLIFLSLTFAQKKSDSLQVIWENEKEIDSICRFAISIMSVEKFEHILTCLHKFPDNFQFRIMSSPARPYTYILIDHNALITEYFRYNIRREAIPNILFSNYSKPDNKDMNALIEQLNNEFEFHTRRNKDAATTININLPLFKSCFYDIYKIQKELVGDIKKIQELGKPKKIKKYYTDIAHIEGLTIHKADYELSRSYALRSRKREENVFNLLEEKKKILDKLVAQEN